jgi:hypothetical protein
MVRETHFHTKIFLGKSEPLGTDVDAPGCKIGTVRDLNSSYPGFLLCRENFL